MGLQDCRLQVYESVKALFEVFDTDDPVDLRECLALMASIQVVDRQLFLDCILNIAGQKMPVSPA